MTSVVEESFIAQKSNVETVRRGEREGVLCWARNGLSSMSGKKGISDESKSIC